MVGAVGGVGVAGGGYGCEDAYPLRYSRILGVIVVAARPMKCQQLLFQLSSARPCAVAVAAVGDVGVQWRWSVAGVKVMWHRLSIL